MTLRRLFFLPILLLLAACGTTATPAAPTAIPATMTGETLSETAAVQDMLGGELSIRYPSGWATKEDGSSILILLATTAELVENTNVTLTTGQIQAALNAIPIELAGAGLPGGTTLTPKTFLEAFVASVKSPSEGTAEPAASAVFGLSGGSPEFGAVEEVTIEGNPAARVTVTSSTGEAIIVVKANSEAYLTLIAATAKGDLASHEALFLEIAGSADYVKAVE